MAFGAPQQQAQDGGDAGGERWEARTVTIVEGDEKKTKSGKVYWRVKDSNGKWYSVWEDAIKIRLETAASSGEALPIAVQIKPGTNGGNPFYTIMGTDAAVESIVTEGKAKAAAASEPGGKNSAFNKRMHPDDALRVSMLNITGHSERIAEFTYADAPEGVSREQWVYAKLPEYNTFLAQLLLQPKTPTPTEAPATEGQGTGSFRNS